MSPRRRADDGTLTQEQRPRKILRRTGPSYPPNDIVVVQVASPSTSAAKTSFHGSTSVRNSLLAQNLWDVYERFQTYAPNYRPLASTRPQTGDGYLKISNMGNFPGPSLRRIHPSRRVDHPSEQVQDERNDQNLRQRPLFNMRGAQVPSSRVIYEDQEEVSDVDRPALSVQTMPSGLGSSYSTPLTSLDAYLESFFSMAFCPGRTINEKNNAWLHHIMPIQDKEMVVRGRRCLSALYVNDLTTESSDANLHMKAMMIRDEMQIFERLKVIQEQSHTLDVLPQEIVTELLATCPIMIQFDIINFEREEMIKLPNKPLRSYLIEFVVELLRTGKIKVGNAPRRNLAPPPPGQPTVEQYGNLPRDWNNDQSGPFTLQSTLMIARHSILSQPMEDLRTKDFEPDREQNKFNWLLHVSELEVCQIDPRLGFSRRLLHYIHAITYLAHGMLVGPRWRWPKFAAAYLHELSEMRQWSKEFTTRLTAMNNSQPIERIRLLDADYKTDSPAEMTSWTAEAWRLAVIAYCQCRLLRLPRNHPDVVAILEDLHHCIRVQPTQGRLFTTEAPLYPVFLLGLLSTPGNPHHRSTSRTWMMKVTANTERSTARPLRAALERTWTWIDQDDQFTPSEPSVLPPEIWKRPAWWEVLVHKISREEKRLLCLT